MVWARKTVWEGSGTMSRKIRVGFICASVIALASVAGAAPLLLYGNNATFSNPWITVMDPTTMTVVDEFVVHAGSNNGRGVVVVGDTLYYTLANSGSVYSYTLSTHTDNGVLFTIPGTTGLSTIAFDGTNIWIGDYSGTNKAYNYTLGGTLLKTISLVDCTGFCDGLEYFINPNTGQGDLIENEADNGDPAHYDIYDTNGNLLTHDFINTTFGGTGISFDGTNFYVSDLGQQMIFEYNGSTGALITSKPITGHNPSFGTELVEDLSFNYQQTLPPPPPGTVPEPASLLLLGSGLATVVARRRRASKR